MTWVLGSGTPFGYAALISDTRVSFGNDGPTADILQKVHPVGSIMIAGFAGSVELGFAMIEDMQASLKIPDGNIWYPRIAVHRWYRRGRRIFSQAPFPLKDLGCSLLFAGISPDKNGDAPWQKTHCIRMASPDFEPEEVPNGSWRSIGSGKHHTWAKSFDRSFEESFNDFAMGEMGMRGGLALSVSTSLSGVLRRIPMRSVGEATVTAIADSQGVKIQGQREIRDIGTPDERVIEPSDLACTWNQFQTKVRGLDFNTAQAIA